MKNTLVESYFDFNKLVWFQNNETLTKKNIFNAIQFGALDFTSTVLTFKRIY